MSARAFLAWLGNGCRWRPLDDWLSGDLAECISGGPWERVTDGQPVEHGPRMCQIFRVAEVVVQDGHLALAFDGLDDLWLADYFRKIRPNQRQACAPWFKAKMKRLRPTVDA
jgi:hypothetical protein